MLTDEFKREDRYLVLKRADMLEHLDRWQYQDVLNLAKRISDGRDRNGKQPLECVVVESDWPEYEAVWGMLKARMTGRAIEAEVRAESQEPVAWFAFADSNGPVPLELWGFDQKACKHAVLENARSVGWKGTVEGYLFQKGWTIRPLGFLAPQPPAPTSITTLEVETLLDNFARACVFGGSEDRVNTAQKIRIALIAQPPAPCPAPLDESRYCPDCDALQAKIAEQVAEIERLKNRLNADSQDFTILCAKETERTLRSTIAQLAERIAELEQNGRVNTGDGTGGTAPRFGFDCTVSPPEIVPATNGAYVHYSNYLELFKQRTASNELIEQCEKALLDNSETWDALDRRKPALAAIAAHRGAAIAKDAP